MTSCVLVSIWPICIRTSGITRWYPRWIQKLVHPHTISQIPGLVGGGGCYLESELRLLKVPWSAEISIWGEGVLWSQNWKYSKCYDLPKFQFFWGERYSGVRTENTQSAKICLNFIGGGGLWSEIPERGSLENLDTNFAVLGCCTQTCLCITDSLSYTTYVETNDNI